MDLDKGKCNINPCKCNDMRILICGRDGFTYLNECWLGCKKVERGHLGFCIDNCHCKDDKNIVCGKDNKTYDNRCKALCNFTDVAY